MSGITLEADGAALRSKQRWYSIKFKCQVTPDLTQVTAYEFLLGAEIPESEWQTHSLTVGDSGSD